MVLSTAQTTRPRSERRILCNPLQSSTMTAASTSTPSTTSTLTPTQLLLQQFDTELDAILLSSDTSAASSASSATTRCDQLTSTCHELHTILMEVPPETRIRKSAHSRERIVEEEEKEGDDDESTPISSSASYYASRIRARLDLLTRQSAIRQFVFTPTEFVSRWSDASSFSSAIPSATSESSSSPPPCMNSKIIALIHYLTYTQSQHTLNITLASVRQIHSQLHLLTSFLLLLSRCFSLTQHNLIAKYHERCTALEVLKEGEVLDAKKYLPLSQSPPRELIQLGGLHDALWRLYETLATHQFFFRYFVVVEDEKDDTEGVQSTATTTSTAAASSSSASSTNLLPHIRRSLISCLSCTIWCLLDPERSRVNPSSLPHEQEDGLASAILPSQEIAQVRFIKHDLLDDTKPRCWIPNLVLFTKLIEVEKKGGGMDSDWNSYMRISFYQPLFTQLELQHDRASTYRSDVPARLLTQHLLSDAIMTSSNPQLHACLKQLIPAMLQTCTNEVVGKLIERLDAVEQKQQQQQQKPQLRPQTIAK